MTETYTVGDSGLPTITKDPDENLDYSFDWTAYLSAASDSISTFAFAVTNATLGATSRIGSVTTAFVSGGTSGMAAVLSCTITTTQGRIVQRSIVLNIEDR